MTSKRRAGGRSGNTRRTSSLVPNQMPWKQPINWDRPTEPLGEEGILNIHNGCMRILKEIGIEFLNPESLEIFKQAGCKVTNTNVKMDEDFVLEMLKKAPEQFTITPRNDAKKIILGGKHMAFGNVSSPPNSWDLKRGKRSGTWESYLEFIKLTQFFNCIHFAGGYPVEPIDIHASVRHLDCLYEKLVLSDKVVHACLLYTSDAADE